MVDQFEYFGMHYEPIYCSLQVWLPTILCKTKHTAIMLYLHFHFWLFAFTVIINLVEECCHSGLIHWEMHALKKKKSPG